MVEGYVDDLVRVLKDGEEVPLTYSGIYSVSPDGNVLATMLYYRTGLPIVSFPCNGCVIIDGIIDENNS